MNEIFIVINEKTNQISRIGQAHKSALADEVLQPNEKFIFESDDILSEESIDMLKKHFAGEVDVEVKEYTDKLILEEKLKPLPAPPAPSPKEILKEEIKKILVPKNQPELISLIEKVREYLDLSYQA